MSLLDDFADYFKARDTPIETWYRDDVGRYAFRVTVADQPFVCCARSNRPINGTTSIMKRVAGRAQTTDALVLLRVPGGIYVFDPVAVLADGDADGPSETNRQRRGEGWIEFDLSLGCRFDDWVDGVDDPVPIADVSAV